MVYPYTIYAIFHSIGVDHIHNMGGAYDSIVILKYSNNFCVLLNARRARRNSLKISPPPPPIFFKNTNAMFRFKILLAKTQLLWSTKIVMLQVWKTITRDLEKDVKFKKKKSLATGPPSVSCTLSRVCTWTPVCTHPGNHLFHIRPPRMTSHQLESISHSSYKTEVLQNRPIKA